MLDDAFKLTLDVIFPGPEKQTQFSIPGHPDSENLWK